MADFYVMAETRQQVLRKLLFKGDVKSISVDFNSWADDNAAVTTATWAVKSGQVAISGQALASNIASALLTASESGTSMITLTVTDGTHTEVQYIRVVAKDPQAISAIPDYGMVTC